MSRRAAAIVAFFGGLVWLANGELFLDAEVTACEVLAQAQDEGVPLFGEESVA